MFIVDWLSGKWERTEGNFWWWSIETVGFPFMLAIFVSVLDWFSKSPLVHVLILSIIIFVISLIGIVVLNKRARTLKAKRFFRATPRFGIVLVASLVSGFLIKNALAKREDLNAQSTMRPAVNASNISGSAILQGDASGPVDIKIDNSTHNGANAKEVVETYKRGVMDGVAEYARTNADQLSQEFGKAYVVFGVTETKNFMPRPPPSDQIVINWAKTNYFVEMTKTSITLHMPDVLFPGYLRMEDNTITFPRVAGISWNMVVPKSRGGVVGTIIGSHFVGGFVWSVEDPKRGDLLMVVKLAAIEPYGAVMVLGFLRRNSIDQPPFIR